MVRAPAWGAPESTSALWHLTPAFSKGGVTTTSRPSIISSSHLSSVRRRIVLVKLRYGRADLQKHNHTRQQSIESLVDSNGTTLTPETHVCGIPSTVGGHGLPFLGHSSCLSSRRLAPTNVTEVTTSMTLRKIAMVRNCMVERRPMYLREMMSGNYDQRGDRQRTLTASSAEERMIRGMWSSVAAADAAS